MKRMSVSWMTLGFLSALGFGWALVASAQTPDQLLALVKEANLRRHLLALEENVVDGKPTYSRSSYQRAASRHAAEYIADQLRRSPGMRVEYENFSGFRNVVGTLPGVLSHPRIYLVVAHYDSKASREQDWNPYLSRAPGANDNATGVAAMLEIARVLSVRQFPHTVRFIAFDAEEIGMLGSWHRAAEAARQRENLAGVINLDMLGFNWWFDRVEVVTNEVSVTLADEFWIAAGWYGLDLEVVRNLDPTLDDSDHRPFWETGYRAVMLTESGTPWRDAAHYVANPYYHTALDTSDKVNVRLVFKVTQLTCAVVADLASRQERLSLPELVLEPPAQNQRNPVEIKGRFVTPVPLRIIVEPGDVEASLDRAAGRFRALLHLKGGPNRVTATALSAAGVRTTSLEVMFEPRFVFQDVSIFPNPASELVQFRCQGDRPIDMLQVKVYQADGTLVRVLEGIPDRTDSRIWRTWWSLKASMGIPVAEGLYPCVFEVETGGETFHTDALLAVER